MSKILVINDNNNFTPSLLCSLCEIVHDCFGARVFFFGAVPLPQKNPGFIPSPLISHNDLKKKKEKRLVGSFLFLFFWFFFR